MDRKTGAVPGLHLLEIEGGTGDRLVSAPRWGGGLGPAVATGGYPAALPGQERASGVALWARNCILRAGEAIRSPGNPGSRGGPFPY